MVSRAATRYLSHYIKDFKIRLEEKQVCGTPCPPSSQLLDHFNMDGLQIVCLDVAVDTNDLDRLTLTVNNQANPVWELWHYSWDVYCYLPESYDVCLARGLDRTSWAVLI